MIISNIPTGILFDECSTFTTFSAAATMDRKYHRSGKKNSFMTYQVVPSHMFLTQFCIFMSNTSTKGWWSHPHFHRSSCITPDRLQDWKAPDKYTHSKYETHKETSLVGQKQKQEKTSKTSTSCKDECIRVKCIVGDKNCGFATARLAKGALRALFLPAAVTEETRFKSPSQIESAARNLRKRPARDSPTLRRKKNTETPVRKQMSEKGTANVDVPIQLSPLRRHPCQAPLEDGFDFHLSCDDGTSSTSSGPQIHKAEEDFHLLFTTPMRRPRTIYNDATSNDMHPVSATSALSLTPFANRIHPVFPTPTVLDIIMH